MVQTALIGSKALGLAIAELLQSRGELAGIVTLNDEADARSVLPALRRMGAFVAAGRHEADAAISRIRAELFVVAGWYWIIPPAVLAKGSFLGIHHSLLPAYRGGSPLVWAMIDGEETVGTTVFSLAEGADEGPIWAQSAVDVGGDYIGEIMARCDDEAVRLISGVLDGKGPLPQAQDHSRATWRSQRRPEDGVIDWDRPAEEVARWVRAQSRPYPGAFSYMNDRRVTVWRAHPADDVVAGPPGTVVNKTVACGNATGLTLEEVEPGVPSGVRLGQPT
jgi:methionyl-tRNA formyltransferase